jgi:hypothetical protein
MDLLPPSRHRPDVRPRPLDEQTLMVNEAPGGVGWRRDRRPGLAGPPLAVNGNRVIDVAGKVPEREHGDALQLVAVIALEQEGVLAAR